MGTYKIGEVPLEYRPKVGGRSLRLHIEIKSTRVVYGWMYMCPKKKRQKEEKYGCTSFYLWFTSIHLWCELCSMV
jgi:hypothetical protein